jgi:hypothetical protein
MNWSRRTDVVCVFLLPVTAASACSDSSPVPGAQSGAAANSGQASAGSSSGSAVTGNGFMGSGLGGSGASAGSGTVADSGVSTGTGTFASGQSASGVGVPEGGTGTEAGQPDAGGGDGAANSACKYQFCETFEGTQAGAPPDPSKWTLDGSPVFVESTRPHTGKMSLHVPPHNGALCTEPPPAQAQTAGCPAARFIRASSAFPAALHKQHYGRVWFYFEQVPNPGQFYHWMVMEANAGTGYYGGLAVRMGGHQDPAAGLPNAESYLRLHIETHMHQIMPYEDGLSDQQATTKTKTWYCLEWYYDAPGNEARFWMDGVERTGLHWTKAISKLGPQFNFPAEFKSVAFGLRNFQVSTTPFELYIDDIALDSQKIGCN